MTIAHVYNNYCNCHPETCSCNPFVVKGGGITISTFYDLDAANRYASQYNESVKLNKENILLKAKLAELVAKTEQGIKAEQETVHKTTPPTMAEALKIIDEVLNGRTS